MLSQLPYLKESEKLNSLSFKPIVCWSFPITGCFVVGLGSPAAGLTFVP
jgi:hypothetical protein